MRHLLLGLVLTLWGVPGGCRDHAGITFDGNIRHFAVSTNWVYVATEQKLYQLNHDLTLIRSLSQRGALVIAEETEGPMFLRVSDTESSNATFSVNVLLPFVQNGTLISCGVTVCGYCELRDLSDISKLLYKENFHVGPQVRRSASVGFLVDVKPKDAESGAQTETYILTAIQRYKDKDQEKCNSFSEAINLHNTNKKQNGGIFSLSGTDQTPQIKREDEVEFVDGFQINSTIYLFPNLPSHSKGNTVRLLWFDSNDSKDNTIRSLRGATLQPSDGDTVRSKLLTSSVIPGGPPVLWSGVFCAHGDSSSTELMVFDISPDPPDPSLEDTDPDFCTGNCVRRTVPPKLLRPQAVLLRQKFMTSVLATRQKNWTVFFIGTGEGQVIKLAVDKAYKPVCLRVIYNADDDRKIFPKMHLDEVDHKHLYVAFKNQMIRVPVSQCNTHMTLKACWSAQDPYCGWCSAKDSCTFEDECPDSIWLSIPDDSQQQKMVSYQVQRSSDGQITLHVHMHLTVSRPAEAENFACQFSIHSGNLCTEQSPTSALPRCSCTVSDSRRLNEGVNVTVTMKVGKLQLQEELKLTNCSNIRGTSSFSLCRLCIAAGCGWSNDGCSWATEGTTNDAVCEMSESNMNSTKPEITSIDPNVVSFYGRNHVVMTGRNLGNVTGVRIQADMDCSPKESPVWNNTGVNLIFHVPSADKGSVKACAVLPDGSCHGNARITYRSLPSCITITPHNTWASGERKITVTGSHLEFVEGIIHSHAPTTVIPVSHHRNGDLATLTYNTPPAQNIQSTFTSTIYVKVANQTLECSTNISYHPNPEFISFMPARTGDDLRLTIEKKADKLNMTTAELSVWAVHEGTEHACEMETIETSSATDSVICEIRSKPNVNIQYLKIKYGSEEVRLNPRPNPSTSPLLLLILLALLLIPCIIIALVIIYRSQQKKLTAKMNRRLEDLELDIRNDIRQGFVDLQTENADLMENVGAIPFLDYKHFASKIFFPENAALMSSCLRDIGQDVLNVRPDESCQALSKLIQDQVFLTSMVHALEEQKTFTIKDKCTVASLLTVALHSNLSYLTEVMETLLKDLMQQNSNTQPKLLLRRTESTVEKLLTNWMSICLYGFLRECVGQHLFLMVSALTQQIAKGPVDCVTEKALYTLNEDWLLWQAQDFNSLKLKVLFAVGSDGEVSEPLEVNALSCDTVEQVKEKILSAFKAKFGFSYNTPLRDVRIEFERDRSFVPLEEVDGSSEVIGEVMMLNTLKHYKVPDGASIKVLSKTHPPLSPQGSLKDDEDFSGKYFHLIDPDVDEDQRKNPERKKLKLKEVHLTKLLSTKVAVHSYVENLFRSIWGMVHCRAPPAVKYFFDFLDTQADNMKISDPDVLHIWKTNSLPLRFWVNILKNPQFVFDMEKMPHLDGCLSVIAQAFMDSFSLSEMQLGKHAPTNKLLYAKDIPKFKQEVKTYYKQVRDQPPITDAEFRNFLLEESKKHENEFNEAAALRELYRFIQRYFTEIKQRLDLNGAPTELTEQLQHVKDMFDGLNSCSWN